LHPPNELKATDAFILQTQTSLTLFIPNPPLSRQGKSLDYLSTYLVDITVEKCKENAVKSICRISHTVLYLSILSAQQAVVAIISSDMA